MHGKLIEKKRRSKSRGRVHYTDFTRLYEVSVKSIIQRLDLSRVAYGKIVNRLKNHPRRLMINDENRISGGYLIKSYSLDCREINRIEILISLKSVRIRKVEFVFFAYFFHEKYIKLEGNSFYKISSILPLMIF